MVVVVVVAIKACHVGCTFGVVFNTEHRGGYRWFLRARAHHFRVRVAGDRRLARYSVLRTKLGPLSPSLAKPGPELARRNLDPHAAGYREFCGKACQESRYFEYLPCIYTDDMAYITHHEYLPADCFLHWKCRLRLPLQRGHQSPFSEEDSEPRNIRYPASPCAWRVI